MKGSDNMVFSPSFTFVNPDTSLAGIITVGYDTTSNYDLFCVHPTVIIENDTIKQIALKKKFEEEKAKFLSIEAKKSTIDPVVYVKHKKYIIAFQAKYKLITSKIIFLKIDKGSKSFYKINRIWKFH